MADAAGPPSDAPDFPSFCEPWEVLEEIGEGASAAVFRAIDARTGELAAFKLARLNGPVIHEARIRALVAGRWAASLLDCGRIVRSLRGFEPGTPYLVTPWIEGAELDPDKIEGDRIRLAAWVAHGVGRALAELAAAGVRHGDVKPANIVLTGREPSRDVPADCAASLIDFGMASRIEQGEVRGATWRYAAPEVRQGGGDIGPQADLFSLGVVLAELLDPAVAAADDAIDAIRKAPLAMDSEPSRWAMTLMAPSAGGRPSAEWLADRAARWLGLAVDPEESRARNRAQVRRAYVAVRSREIAASSSLDASMSGEPRAWLEPLLAVRSRMAPPGREPSVGAVLGPLDALGLRRWLLALAGPSAIDWPLPAETEAELGARLLALADKRTPSAWTLSDLAGTHAPSVAFEGPPNLWIQLARALSAPRPSAAVLRQAEHELEREPGMSSLAVLLALALSRRGETGRAWAVLSAHEGAEVDALRADLARRRGDVAEAQRWAERAVRDASEPWRSQARAVLGRLAWERGGFAEAEAALRGGDGPAVAEVAALVAHGRGDAAAGLVVLEQQRAHAQEPDALARLDAMRGLLEHALARPRDSVGSFRSAAEFAARSGWLLEEATYLTGVAAAASEAGAMAEALDASTRAALLWERFGNAAFAARAWLARAATLAALGATHAADEAAEEAIARSTAVGDPRAVAFAHWAIVETRAPGDPRARKSALAADALLADAGPEDRLRSAARVLVWAREDFDVARIAELDASAERASAAARWEWWGARAVELKSSSSPAARRILDKLLALLGSDAPLYSMGPSLHAASELARALGEGEALQRLERALGEAAAQLRKNAPAAFRSCVDEVPWAAPVGSRADGSPLSSAQLAHFESIVRSLATRDRLRPLLEQVLDALLVWTGAERGLLLLRAPDGRLVPRVARNLAGADLRGEQLALSQGIARRAIESGEAIVATDALATLGELHASVHTLRLRSVLALPLHARGDILGVVYLDDRARRGAFGPRELSWVRLLGTQAAMAIADARDQVLLRRAARRAERARGRATALLEAREAELDACKVAMQVAEPEGTRFRYDPIVGRSAPMRALLSLVDRVIPTDVPVLIVGESGSGKELIARALHANGPRANKPFVGENCASVPEPLLESTLFGHVRGAFTGASSTRAGLFDVADGGTLFLDEIGEMSLAMQSKLLRVLQDGEVRSVGGERTRRVDVRIVAATHRDLAAMVEGQRFREDLLYRLNVISLRVPPLRERRDDIAALITHFLRKHAPERKVRVSRAAMDRLTSYPWPGNVRQLENEIRRAIVLTDDAIDVGELSPDVAKGGPQGARSAGLDMRSRVDQLEAELVRDALAQTRGNQTKAAALLGLSRFGLQKMIRRLQIET